jgi:hypothetical protein
LPDEPEEVAVMKTALIQHLELNSEVTLGVLCNEIPPPDDPMEVKDRAIREHLCRLVIAFLPEDARKFYSCDCEAKVTATRNSIGNW